MSSSWFQHMILSQDDRARSLQQIRWLKSFQCMVASTRRLVKISFYFLTVKVCAGLFSISILNIFLLYFWLLWVFAGGILIPRPGETSLQLLTLKLLYLLFTT